jgi:hypothetical protein
MLEWTPEVEKRVREDNAPRIDPLAKFVRSIFGEMDRLRAEIARLTAERDEARLWAEHARDDGCSEAGLKIANHLMPWEEE